MIDVPLPSGTQYATVLLMMYGIIQSATLYMVIKDVWRERWNGKFRNNDELDTSNLDKQQYADGDLHAFVETLYDHTVPSINWYRVFIVPFGAAILTTFVWWLITAVSAIVVNGGIA